MRVVEDGGVGDSGVDKRWCEDDNYEDVGDLRMMLMMMMMDVLVVVDVGE